MFVVLWKNCGVLCDGSLLVEWELLALAVLIYPVAGSASCCGAASNTFSVL
jgi:hypothetical protein